ncbi:MAG: hypothetical protein PHV37_07300 [Candidatus Gastranaerophilales bacterium]|nr:hypothetical protein [Candidatus Gastranaerophilales bacterium]
MPDLFDNILNFIFELQKKFYQKKYKKLHAQSNMVFKDSTTTTSMNGACTLKLTTKTEANKAKVNLTAKEIIKKNIKTPEKLLDLIQAKGTKVYKFAIAEKVLGIIGEEEGFITPLKGLNAIFLNLCIGIFCEKKINLNTETKEMFIMRNLPVDIYVMSHQFHKWYGYKMHLPGYDADTQRKFKHIYKTFDDAEIKEFSMAEVISLKEAVARNVESIDFVVELAKEYDGSKKSLAKIKTQKGACI